MVSCESILGETFSVRSVSATTGASERSSSTPLEWSAIPPRIALFCSVFFLNAPPALQRDLRLPPYNSSHVCPSARITKQSGTPQPEFWWKDMLTWNRSRRTLRSRVSRLHRAANLLRSEWNISIDSPSRCFLNDNWHVCVFIPKFHCIIHTYSNESSTLGYLIASLRIEWSGIDPCLSITPWLKSVIQWSHSIVAPVPWLAQSDVIPSEFFPVPYRLLRHDKNVAFKTLFQCNKLPNRNQWSLTQQLS